MKRETRVEKYAKLRENIEHIDATILKELENKKNAQKENIIKDSMKHCSSNNMAGINSNQYSIDEILKGHTEYINVDFDKTKVSMTKKTKWKYFICILACVIFIVVFIIIVMSMGGK